MYKDTCSLAGRFSPLESSFVQGVTKRGIGARGPGARIRASHESAALCRRSSAGKLDQSEAATAITGVNAPGTRTGRHGTPCLLLVKSVVPAGTVAFHGDRYSPHGAMLRRVQRERNFEIGRARPLPRASYQTRSFHGFVLYLLGVRISSRSFWNSFRNFLIIL